MKQITKDFVCYLIDAGLVTPAALGNKKAMETIEELISNPADYVDDTSASVQFFLTEYSEWCELYHPELVPCDKK